ncbi:RNA polymerase sigma factor [Longirhabdus pacifica]|uniref:RNA polymerase sigma factor n=1 Tax=Longirhabdus pacifica TaxID=2305227 RepID=UPI001008FA40|nr:sigma-70 family RNA polymerase sigma factor [Longirhabdus pacifica]
MAGHKQAFGYFTEKYYTYIYHLVIPILRHEADAEDVTQEVFITIYRALPQYKKQGLKTWIARIAVNKAIDLKRKRARQHEQLTDEFDEMEGVLSEQTIEQQVLLKEEKKQLYANIDAIPEHYRQVIHAYYIEEKSYKQIANEYGLEIKSVESKLYRAKKWIKNHWRDDDEETLQRK